MGVLSRFKKALHCLKKFFRHTSEIDQKFQKLSQSKLWGPTTIWNVAFEVKTWKCTLILFHFCVFIEAEVNWKQVLSKPKTFSYTHPILSSAVHQCSQPQQSFTNKRCQKKRRRCMDFFHISAFLDICFGAWLFRSLCGCLYMLFLEEKDLAQPKWIQMWKNMPSWFGLNWAEIKVVTFEMDDSFRYTTPSRKILFEG